MGAAKYRASCLRPASEPRGDHGHEPPANPNAAGYRRRNTALRHGRPVQVSARRWTGSFVGRCLPPRHSFCPGAGLCARSNERLAAAASAVYPSLAPRANARARGQQLQHARRALSPACPRSGPRPVLGGAKGCRTGLDQPIRRDPRLHRGGLSAVVSDRFAGSQFQSGQQLGVRRAHPYPKVAHGGIGGQADRPTARSRREWQPSGRTPVGWRHTRRSASPDGNGRVTEDPGSLLGVSAGKSAPSPR